MGVFTRPKMAAVTSVSAAMPTSVGASTTGATAQAIVQGSTSATVAAPIFLAVAAGGPNYGDGDPDFRPWELNNLRDGEVILTPANYGVGGSTQGFGEGRSKEKVREITWDPGPVPGLNPFALPWNLAPRQSTWARTTIDANSTAAQQSGMRISQIGPPVSFAEAGVAGLDAGDAPPISSFSDW